MTISHHQHELLYWDRERYLLTSAIGREREEVERKKGRESNIL